LKWDEKTLEVYPFKFSLTVSYILDGNTLITKYAAENLGNEAMWFSIGGHPAINCPLNPGLRFEDYYLEFDKNETAGVYRLEGGLLADRPRPFFDGGKTIRLEHGLFTEDALIFKNLNSTSVTLRSDKSPERAVMDFKGFPFFGVWTKPGAPYICLEPWLGIDESHGFSGGLTEKEGIQSVEPGGVCECSFSLSFFL